MRRTGRGPAHAAARQYRQAAPPPVRGCLCRRGDRPVAHRRRAPSGRARILAVRHRGDRAGLRGVGHPAGLRAGRRAAGPAACRTVDRRRRGSRLPRPLLHRRRTLQCRPRAGAHGASCRSGAAAGRLPPARPAVRRATAGPKRGARRGDRGHRLLPRLSSGRRYRAAGRTCRAPVRARRADGGPLRGQPQGTGNRRVCRRAVA